MNLLMLLTLFVFIINVNCQFYRPSSCHTPKIAHGKTRIRQKGRMIRFVCDPTYVLVGNKYASCRNGQWDEPVPVCTRSGCGMLTLEHGMTIPSRGGAWVLFFCLPNYRLVGSSAAYCDGFNWNTTVPKCVEDTDKPPELSCDFENPGLCGWRQDETHDFDWKRLNKKTPSSFLNTGPSFDHTLGKGNNGYYMYIESTSKLQNDSARLLSPIFNKELSKDGCFSFYYHMFGGSIGTLKVYQKPDNLDLQTLLTYSDGEQQKYLLFDKSGNQGDIWYQSVSPLTNFNDDFQIVIEGIRGSSFTSDIAIDDVDILQGENCTKILPTTPQYDLPIDSCVNRCSELFDLGIDQYAGPEVKCSCFISCASADSCCPDFFDVCVYNPNSPQLDDNDNDTSSQRNEMAPQTQKLVASPHDYSTISTTKASPPSTVTSTTQRTTTTTKSITTTKRITTQKTIPSLVYRSTTQIYNATGRLIKEKTNATIKPIVKNTTVTATSKTTTPVTTTKATSTTVKAIVTTVNTTASKTTIATTPEIHQLVQYTSSTTKSTSSSGKIVSIILCVFTLGAAIACLALASRTWRGRLIIARLRGHSTNHQEVQYLTRDQDDDIE